MNNREKSEKYGLYDPRFEHDSCGVGFVCDIAGNKSHRILEQGLEVLRNLAHRGATGADPKTGDGAGLLIQLPHEFFLKVFSPDLPVPGGYGAGLVFLPQNKQKRIFCKETFSRIIQEEECLLLGWRTVPVNNSDIGKAARDTQPIFEQIFIGSGNKYIGLDFERKLYIIRKRVENIIRAEKFNGDSFYITNLSSRSLSYKGLLMPEQLGSFFCDLKDKDMISALSLVHSRYSTNTFPTWDLAQPFRFLAHNGEINTLRGNINWMQARQRLLKSGLFGADIEKVFPVVVPGGSDSAAIDNVFELLVLGGRSMAHAMMMLIPSAWEQNVSLSEDLRSFYKYHACLMEPWDGPAAIAFSDGIRIGAVLDRNGLRPARYIVTRDNLVVMSSEAGVLDIAPEDIAYSGRLEPGKIFFVDTEAGKIIDDAQIKQEVSRAKPYACWLKENMFEIDKLNSPHASSSRKLQAASSNVKDPDITIQLKAFGYTREDIKFIIEPMAKNAQEPVGSMGNDTPQAFLSKNTQLLYSYFKQLFAQVTNPAIDPIREELVMSLYTYLGPKRNLLAQTPKHCRNILVGSPILTNEEIGKIKRINKNGFKTKVVSLLFAVANNYSEDMLEDSFETAIKRICQETGSAVQQGYTFIILSDRSISRGYAALPALLATGALQQYLIKKGLRDQVSILIESAEPREVHHFALLFGYGADCVNPYLAYTIAGENGAANYIKAVEKGILKILSKMGISTLQSYRGAQIFEALGLDKKFIDKYFTATVSRIGGAGLKVIAKETILRHQKAFDLTGGQGMLSAGGHYQWKKDGESHLWNPDSIAALQDAVRNNDPKRYREFSLLINDQARNPATLRSLLRFREANPIPIEQVESEEKIMRRFATGAMSFGSISGACHKTIAIAMNRLGAKSNTGEGGEDPRRFKPFLNGDSARSAIKQVASGRFGVTTNYLVNADELQIKISQGAKPGEGGQLPGHKVSAIIARTRYTTPGVTLISPPPHHDIYSIEDLAQLIFDLKNVNPCARISVKLVSEIGVGTVAAGVAKGHADMILISGGDGGTGASPLSSIKHAGLPWELGLSETHQTLLLNGLRSRVRLQTDGQMRTGGDVAIAAILGAEEFGFSSAVLVTLGCVMLRHCHLNNCSLGVATQDEVLEKRFTGRPEHIINYFRFVAGELRQIMSSLGISRIDEMIGRTELLELNKEILPWKAEGFDPSRILYKPDIPESADRYCTISQNHMIDNVLDHKLIDLSLPAFSKGKKIKNDLMISNNHRAVGAMLSGKVCKEFGEDGLPQDSLYFKFKGVAGQSFGAWLAKGLTLELEGMANDYVGKGISGGKIIIYPDKKAKYLPQENIIIGNTAFYGAINGEAYISGIAGERFCIRNSGLNAVVEGVGDHACEYMTGGRVLILGACGRNFGAGMSGGIAYVYADKKYFTRQYNSQMVNIEDADKADLEKIKELLSNHYRYTQSLLAGRILDNFAKETKRFIKVMPLEYKRILRENSLKDKEDLSEVSDG
jgi:glutamate synthase domain-containing protein 2/glutamate synthase domain-containing protein 1/glutamate synthase domain-containing protein 3